MRRNTSFGFLAVLSATSIAIAVPPVTFDDGTTQGWTVYPAGGGVLTAPLTGGNPGGYLQATDTAGGAFFAKGPAAFQGDLSVYTGVTWDEIIFDLFTTPSASTGITLFGADGSIWSYLSPLLGVNAWRSRSASFTDDTGWQQFAGPSSFFQTLQNCTLAMSLDTSPQLVLESGVDNIQLVPEPSGLVLLAVGMVGLRRRSA